MSDYGSPSDPPSTDKVSSSSKKKIRIDIQLDGVHGKHSSHFSSRCGEIIRAVIPVGFDDWRKLDRHYKDLVWAKLMVEFEPTIDEKTARPILEQKFAQYYRTEKAKIRSGILKENGVLLPKNLAIEKRPNAIDKVWWEKFIEVEYSEKKIQQCKVNAENRKKNKINHTLGRTPYRTVYDELEKQNPGEKVSRTMAWKVAHTSKKTGEVTPSAAEAYGLIVAADERQKSEAGSNESRCIVDFENDPIAEVFGADKNRSYCRAISSTSTPKQVKMSQASKAVASYQLYDTNQRLESIEEKLSQNTQQMQVFMQQFMTRFEMQPNMSHISTDASGSSARGKKDVEILSRDGDVVGKGHVDVGRQICHGRKLLPGEAVVWVQEVINPDAPIFEAPQDGHYILSDISDGGFLIWPEYRLRFV